MPGARRPGRRCAPRRRRAPARPDDAAVVAEAHELRQVGGSEGQPPRHVVGRARETNVVDGHGPLLSHRSLANSLAGAALVGRLKVKVEPLPISLASQILPP